MGFFHLLVCDLVVAQAQHLELLQSLESLDLDDLVAEQREHLQLCQLLQVLDLRDFIEAQINPFQVAEAVKARDRLDEVVVQEEPGQVLQPSQVVDLDNLHELETKGGCVVHDVLLLFLSQLLLHIPPLLPGHNQKVIFITLLNYYHTAITTTRSTWPANQRSEPVQELPAAVPPGETLRVREASSQNFRNLSFEILKWERGTAEVDVGSDQGASKKIGNARSPASALLS